MKNLNYFSVLVVVLSAFIFADAQSPSLSPPAQKALDAGIAAAKAGDYPAAIKSLDEARRAAPDAPAIYFNLGLAESKIPGRELRAVCALEAYLALNPNAENAPAVRNAIGSLEAASRANIDKLIEVLKVGFAGLKSAPSGYGRQPEISFPILYLKYGQADQIEGLIKNFKRPDQWYTKPDDARLGLIKVLVALGRMDEALGQANLMTDRDKKASAAAELARGFIAAKRFREAKSQIEGVDWTNGRFSILLDLAVEEVNAGVNDDGEARFQDAQQFSQSEAKRMEEPWYAIRDLPDLAFARWRMGQKDAAEALLRQTLVETEAITGKNQYAKKVHCILSYSTTLELMGRHAEAVKIMEKAVKFWQNETRDNEEGVGIISEGGRIYEHYRWLKEWKKTEDFIVTRLDVNKRFDGGMTGLKRWIATYQDEVARGKARRTATDAVNNTVTNAGATPEQRAAAWMRYSDEFMTAPIFVSDFNVMIKNLVDYSPPNDVSDKPQAIFAHIEEPAEALVDALNNIHAMREKRPIVTEWPV